MKQKIKGKPHFKAILDFMQWILTSMLSTSDELKRFKRVGRLLSDYDLPKKEDDVCYIIERLEKMKEYCNNEKRIERLQYARNYLDVLVLEIRLIFFRTRIFELFMGEKDIKITLNDGTEIIIIRYTLGEMTNPVTGTTPKGEDVKVYFHDIKLQGGIKPISLKEKLDIEVKKEKRTKIKAREPVPSGEKGFYIKKDKNTTECKVHNSIEHIQSINGLCPGCGKR